MPHPDEQAHPQPPGLREISHKGRQIVYRNAEGRFELTIDGRSFTDRVERWGPGRYFTRMLPYMVFSSPEALARALVSHLERERQLISGQETP